jgi:hypothetical protein
VRNFKADAKNGLPKNVALRKQFTPQRFLPSQARQAFIMECEVSPNKRAAENFTPVFLEHVRLYVFADRYDIQPVRTLTLS